MENKTVLVVDDSMTDFLYVSNILVKNGYQVVHAQSGKDAIEEARRVHPDCILMDVVMPEMNGFQATRLISREATTSDIPIIMLSSKAQKTDKVWAQRQGATGYLVKPIESQRLVSALKRVLN